MFPRRMLPLLISLTLAFGAIAYGQDPRSPVQDRGDREVECDTEKVEVTKGLAEVAVMGSQSFALCVT